MSSNIFGIDLGTSNIKIYNRADDTILVEKNMIAIENKSTLLPMEIPPLKCTRKHRPTFIFPIRCPMV